MRPLYRFDDVILDLEAFRLTRRGAPVHLEPKVLELLGYLVQQRGRLVEKQELQAALWSDAAVSESALTRAVAQLRKALDDDAREARYVETVPTRGYRFRSEVRVEEGRNGAGPVDESPAPGPSPTKGRSLLLGASALAVLGLAAAAVVRWPATRSPAGEAEPAREVQRTLVSTSRGYNGFPAFSPDGGTLAFSSDRSGRLEIYLRPLVPGAREVPVTSDGQDNVQPAWSPDGRYLAYHSLRRGGLWLLPALGGTPRQISEFGSAPAWSPDGRRIAFTSLGLASLESIGAQYGASLWTLEVAADSARPQPLTEPGRPPAGHGPPAFSPDGRHIFFVAEGVWATPVNGGGPPHQVVDGSATDIALSPDGQTLYWTVWERMNWRVWMAPLGAGATVIGPRVEVTNTADQAARHLTMSRQGRLACGMISISSELALVPLGSDGGVGGPALEPLPGMVGRKRYLHFSPDGRTLAFARAQAGQGFEIWGLDLRSREARPLLPGAGLNVFNGWFPDGDALLVTGRDDSGAKSLLRVPLTGERAERLLHERRASRSSASTGYVAGGARLVPSGREVVFHAVTGGRLGVHAVPLDGGRPRPLTDDPQGAGWPVPSPDGRQLVVELFRGNDTQLGVMPLEGGTPRPLTRLPGQHWAHDWSPDGRRVLYAARRDGLWNVYWMDVETGEERRLTDQGRVRDAVRTPAWSPAGNRIAYERLETSGAVWVLDLEAKATSGAAAAR